MLTFQSNWYREECANSILWWQTFGLRMRYICPARNTTLVSLISTRIPGACLSGWFCGICSDYLDKSGATRDLWGFGSMVAVRESLELGRPVEAGRPGPLISGGRRILLPSKGGTHRVFTGEDQNSNSGKSF